MTPSGWVEVGDRCWMRRYPEWDVNVGVVAGRDGVLVIDTRGTLEQGKALLGDVRSLGAGRIRAVANTHWHFDHTYGNAAFATDAGEQFLAHANAARDLAATPALVPTRVFEQHATVDLGDRRVVLHHLGRGHTDGDVVLTVDDVVFAGDLIEESADPSFGDDSYPLEWPATVAALVDLTGPASVVVPGHGSAVNRTFVERQHADLAAVASTLRQLHEAGVALSDALRHEDWPYPRHWLADAVRRGYAHLRA